MTVGKVYLVGAGPGDPGLITVKGLRVLQEADVVVHDRLVDRRLLQHARPGAEVVDAGKARERHRMTQGSINALLVEHARQGKTVVRLKGGDPFVFGRGGEEAEALAEAGIPFEVVPGVTSAIAGPAYAGIPLTHRAHSSSLAVVTGNEDPTREYSRVSWRGLAGAVDTLVVLMGLETLPGIVQELRQGGLAEGTPIALVNWGTQPYQRTVVGTLGDIAERAQEAGLEPPVVAVIGSVVGLRERLSWFETKPLFGKRVLVTRTRHQASSLVALLQEQGAEVVEVPSIAIEPLPLDTAATGVLERLEQYAWLVFTSANGVEVFFQHLESLGRDSRALGRAKVCAIGPATAQALRQRGVHADLVPREYVAESVVEALAEAGVAHGRVLLARAVEGRAELRRGLEDAGASVEELPLYRTVVPPESRDLARKALSRGVDVATFTSSSTVRNLAGLLDGGLEALGNAVIACIGPVTAATARELGLTVRIQAEEYTIPGLVRALIAYYATSGGG